MHVIMFDRQSIFIHGAISSLRGLIPELNICGTSQADELWAFLSQSPAATLLLDGNMNHEYCLWLLDELAERYPEARVAVVLAQGKPEWVETLVQHEVSAIVPRNAPAEMFASVLQMVESGMVCFPKKWLGSPSPARHDLSCLSERQREVLRLLAEGESNKEIGRALNISAGTVKAHLETLFRRLEVKNRTQAALIYTRAA